MLITFISYTETISYGLVSVLVYDNIYDRKEHNLSYFFVVLLEIYFDLYFLLLIHN